MVTRNYKDYTIVVDRISSNIGEGFRAWFFIPKGNGLKECSQGYETYRRKTFKDTFADVKSIIDAL